MSKSGERTETCLIKFKSSPKSDKYGKRGFINFVSSSIERKYDGNINSHDFLKLSLDVSFSASTNSSDQQQKGLTIPRADHFLSC